MLKFSSLFLVILVVLIAHPVDSQHNATTIIVFNINRPLVLSCNLTLPEINGTREIQWYKNGTHVGDVEELRERYQVISEEQMFVIERTHVEDHGLYSCALDTNTTSAEMNFKAVAHVAARLTKETQLIEGENLWLHCRVIGTDPVISWILPDGKNTTVTNSTDRVSLFEMDGIPNAALEILNVHLDERGNYTCVVRNLDAEMLGHEPTKAYGMVRVRSHLAPLWPVCGTLVEFFILFIILYFYEKYRDPEDVDDDSVCDYMPKGSKRN
ncbi:hypothetical protein DMENIID0001_130620 [Sergentomyia squamirostris]